MQANSNGCDPYLLRPEVPVLIYLSGLPLFEDPCKCDATENDAESGHSSYPDVDEAWRKVISISAYRTPSFLVSAQGLLEPVRSFEVTTPEFPESVEARERARIEDLHLYRNISLGSYRYVMSSKKAVAWANSDDGWCLNAAG